jgi:predicted dehydrogenase
MLYPTHSVSMIVSVTGARMTQVTALGYRDRGEDGIYRAESNPWGNPFSNQSALFRMSDGSVARINEFRRIGHRGCVRMRLYGTRAGFEEQAGAQAWVDKARSGHEDLAPLLKIFEGAGPPPGAAEGPAADRAPRSGLAPVHDAGRLPPELLEHRPAHGGSHVFLVDDFVRACTQEALPLIHVWEAARYLVPGLMAHRSAMREGETISVPDLGDPAAGWRRVKLD